MTELQEAVYITGGCKVRVQKLQTGGWNAVFDIFEAGVPGKCATMHLLLVEDYTDIQLNKLALKFYEFTTAMQKETYNG